MENIEALREEVLAEIEKAADLQALEDVRISALGKKGRITGLMKNLGQMDPDQRREFGQTLNTVKDQVAEAIETRKSGLEDAALNARLVGERIDVTLPSRMDETAGRIHPISQTMDEIISIFGEMGFALAEGPDVEDDFHNFTALNIPPEHPAREMQDTFYLPEQEDGSRLVLRTHTSPVQIRTMQSKTPPIRIIAPGRTYRSDSDMTHTPMFHQVEG
ncbi:phenylalanine--tRNA ligase subunit alpha, partial [Thalassospira sp.]